MKIIITTSSFPANEEDHVPSFVLDQVKALYQLDNSLRIYLLIPHNSYKHAKNTPNVKRSISHTEIRYHYFYPSKYEKLTGRGILPALKENPLRYTLIPFLLLAQRLCLIKLCRRIKPDIVYAHWFTPQAIIASSVCQKLKIPLMFTTHASDVAILKKIPFGKKIVAKVLSKTKTFTSVSQRTETKMKSFFDHQDWDKNYQKKSHIIPMGINLTTNHPINTTTESIFNKFNINRKRKVLLSIGRLSEKKGIKYLISAYSSLPIKTRQDYQLIIAGDGQLMPKLKKIVKDRHLENDIIFTGYLKETPKMALFNAAEIFILPSIIDGFGDSEGLPVSIMEALNAGKPIITTNVSGGEEIITQKTGIVVNQKSPEEIKNAIIKLLSLPQSKKNEIMRNSIALSKQFSWEVIAKRHLQLLKQTTSKKTNS